MLLLLLLAVLVCVCVRACVRVFRLLCIYLHKRTFMERKEEVREYIRPQKL